MIRVAHVWRHTDAGGSEATFMRMYAAMDHSQVQFDFFVENTGMFINREKIESLGGRVFIVPPLTRPLYYQKVLREIFRREKYDIVHAHINELSYFPLKAAKAAGVPIRIAHAHSGNNMRDLLKTTIKSLIRPNIKKVATHLWAVSEYSGAAMFGENAVDNKQVTIIYNALNLVPCAFDNTKRLMMREQLKIDNHQLVVGHVGRLTRQKNQPWLVRVFAEVVKKQPLALLLIIGEGSDYVKLQRQVARLGITDKVIFLPNQTNIADYYQVMDVFVLPSLYEGLPGVSVEAQYNGLPCVLSETITREADRHVPSTKVTYLPLSNAKLWADIILAQKHGQTEPDFFRQFDQNNQSNYLLELYQNMVVGEKL